jgi:hypothetical protein
LIKKDRGLAVLAGVGRCHEVRIGEGLVNRLAIEATLGALLLFLLQFGDLLAESRSRQNHPRGRIDGVCIVSFSKFGHVLSTLRLADETTLRVLFSQRLLVNTSG